MIERICNQSFYPLKLISLCSSGSLCEKSDLKVKKLVKLQPFCRHDFGKGEKPLTKRLQWTCLFPQASYNMCGSKRQTRREAGTQSHGSSSHCVEVVRPPDRRNYIGGFFVYKEALAQSTKVTLKFSPTVIKHHILEEETRSCTERFLVCFRLCWFWQ